MTTGTFTLSSLRKKILEPLIKSSRKGLKKFKPCIHNVVVLWNIAFYMCLSLRVIVKCTGAIFVCKWIESIGWTPEKIVILIQIGWGFSIGMLWFIFILSLIILLLIEAKLIVTCHLTITLARSFIFFLYTKCIFYSNR